MAPPFTGPYALSQFSLFRRVPTRELERLAPLLHERGYPANTNVIVDKDHRIVVHD